MQKWPQTEGKPGDRAVYTVLPRDDENGFDSWITVPEADPPALIRAIEQHRTDLYCRVDRDGLLVPNLPNTIEINRDF